MSDDFHVSEESFLPEPRMSAEVRCALVESAEHRMLAPAREAGYQLTLVGATVLPQRQTIARTKHGTWLFVNHLDDPTTKQYGGRIPIPEEQLARLREMDKHGVSPDHVFIGHELPDNYRDGETPSLPVPAPRHLREKDERLKLELEAGTRIYLAGVLGLLGAAAAGPLALAAAVGAGIDPIIFGGVQHPRLPIVQWCVLAHWVWE